MTSRRYLAGVLLIVVGLGFLLQQAGFWSFGKFISMWWPMIIVFAGAYQLTKRTVSPVAGMSVLAIGILLQLKRFPFIPPGLKNVFWPLLLVGIGLAIIFSKSEKGEFNGHLDNDDFIDHFVAFSGLKTKNRSLNFKGGSTTVLFGGAEIDLLDAKMVTDVSVSLNAIFGGIDIIVPGDWKVVATGLPLFGSWENKTDLSQSNEGKLPVLRVKCLALFGGVEIKN